MRDRTRTSDGPNGSDPARWPTLLPTERSVTRHCCFGPSAVRADLNVAVDSAGQVAHELVGMALVPLADQEGGDKLGVLVQRDERVGVAIIAGVVRADPLLGSVLGWVISPQRHQAGAARRPPRGGRLLRHHVEA